MVEEVQLEPLLHTLGKAHRVRIIFLLNKRRQRFSQIGDEIKISSKVLIECLRELATIGIVKRVEGNGQRPIYYRLTKNGKILVEILTKMQKMEANK
jgi:DNA-binding HxlR family transcriptional regulator